jgi:hypothetical protein
MAVQDHLSVVNRDSVARQSNHSLDVAFGVIARILEDDYVAMLHLADAEGHLVDKQAIVVLQVRQHRCPFHANRLVQEHNNNGRNQYG